MTQARRSLGQQGEQMTADWYEERGFDIVERNWRSPDGELDLIARLGDLVVFCEVKTRSSDAFGAPVEAVTPGKVLRLRRLAAQWLTTTDARAGDVRFDVASVMGGNIDVLESAF